MIAYNAVEQLQNKISDITLKLHPNTVKSICGNKYYLKTFRDVFKSKWYYFSFSSANRFKYNAFARLYFRLRFTLNSFLKIK